MTVQTTALRGDYTGNGVTTIFVVPFYFLENSHVQIDKLDTLTNITTTLALTTDYTLAGAGVGAGGTATLLVAPLSTDRIAITRNVPYTQQTHYVPGDPFPSQSHEAALDKLTMLAQQLDEESSRAVKAPASAAGFDGELSAMLPSRLVGTNAAGTGFELVAPSSGSATDLALDLADTTSAVKGANKIGFNSALAYAAGTVGAFLRSLTLSTGASVIGFIQAGVGAVARTVQDKGRDTLSVFDWMSDTERSDVASRTGSIDVSSKVLAAHTAAALTGKTLVFPAGVYGWASATTIPTAPQWEGEGVANLDSTGQVSQGAVILCKVATGDYAVKIDPGANPFAAGFSIKGLKFKGNGTARNGMTIKNVGNDGHFSNVTWDNFLENGLDCDYAQDVIFDDCTWYKSGQTAGSYGLTIRGGSNLLTFNRPRIEHCTRGHRITGGCFGIQFNDPHFELGDYGGVNAYNDYYTDPPFIIDATGGICSGIKYKGGWLVPVSVQTLMDHYTITADNTAYLFSSTDCQDLSFDGVTFIHGSKGGKFLKVVATQRDYMATVDGCTFNRPDCRIAAVDIQEGVFSNNQIHIYDNQTTDIFKFGLFSFCLVDGNKIDCTNPSATTKTSGYVFEAYGDTAVFNKKSILGMNTYYYDKGYKFANSQWACSPSAQCPVKAVGFAPVAGVYDLELYRDGTIFQPGTVTITAINNAKQGQIVKIMGVGGGNPTITNTASILLKGGINAGPLAANNILTLQDIDGDGKLYEIARNF